MYQHMQTLPQSIASLIVCTMRLIVGASDLSDTLNSWYLKSGKAVDLALSKMISVMPYILIFDLMLQNSTGAINRSLITLEGIAITKYKLSSLY
jgi:hypothetical protein